ncbi:unnamed protein product [Rhizopus stolonifer]
MKIQALVLCAVAFATIDGNMIRAPIYRNNKPSNALESAKKRFEFLSKRRLNKRASYETTLYNDAASQYLVQVSIGTPAQTFTVTLDTGSADLWVPSSSCPSSECPLSRFDSTNSSTFKSLSESFSIQYGIGSANGTYATDTVSVGGASVSSQQFGLASSTSDILDSASSNSNSVQGDGILGLGYPSLTQANSQGSGSYNPFVFNLVSQNIISDPVFSIYLNSYSETGWSGEIIFGGVDSTKYDGDLAYLPVAGLTSRSSGLFGSSSSSYYYWMVYGTGVAVVNSTQGSNPTYTFSQTGAFILDTGTTLTYLPTTVAEEMVAAFAGSGGYVYDSSSGVYVVSCSTASSTATFQLIMSQSSSSSSNPVTLSVPASQLVIPLDSTNINTASTCMFGIAPVSSSSLGSNMYLIGDSVLRSAYMVFDMGNNRVGLAASKGVGGSVTSSNTSSTDSSSATSLKQSMGLLVLTASMALWML